MTMDARRTRRRRVGIGAAIIAALVAGALVIFFLDDMRQATRTTYEVAAVFPTAGELRAGADVRIAGETVGRVVDVGFLPGAVDTAGPVVAVLELPAERRELIRRGSRVRMREEGLAGQAVIDIMPGPADAPALSAGDTLVATAGPDAGRVARRARIVVGRLDSVLADARVIRRRATGTDVVPLLDRARALGDELDRFEAAYPRGSLGLALQDTAWQASLRRVRRNLDELDAAVRARTRMLAGTDTLGARLGRGLRRVNRRVALLRRRIAELGELMAASGGLLPRLARDTALQAALQRVRVQVDSLVAETRSDPLRYIF